MIIRPARQSDCDIIGQLWARLVAYHRALDNAMPQAAPDGPQRYAARVTGVLHDAHHRTYVAEIEGKIVGYVTGMIVDMRPDMFEEEVSGMIADIYVQDEARGRGVGRALVRAMEAFFATRGIAHYEWFVAQANRDGQAFWQVMQGVPVAIRMRATIQPDGDSA